VEKNIMLDEIVSIERLDIRDTVDIEVGGNHLFYANGILTHNSSTDLGLEDTSESFGLPATADFMFALITSEELEQLNQIMVKQLKNRYGDPSMNKKFVIGIDKAKMKLYDVEANAQKIVDSGQVDDRPSKFTSNDSHNFKSKFGGIKV
jgi:hypothetical protein